VIKIRPVGILKQSKEARNQVGIGMWYQPASLCSLAELIPIETVHGSLKVLKYHLYLLIQFPSLGFSPIAFTYIPNLVIISTKE
jgi:hypothetical protein